MRGIVKPGRSPWRWATVGLCLLAVVAFAAWLALRLTPLPRALFAPPPPGLALVDRRGLSLREVPQQTNRFARQVSIGGLPGPFIQATLAAEDKRFWQHHGVDWRATARAALGLVRHRRIVSGGSTITQQLIKLAQPRPRSFRTKLIEAAQALRLEQVWGKQRILAEYLNRVDYGNLCFGSAEAGAYYFGKPLGELSVAEAAFLAGLPQGPSRLNPLRHFAGARQRQQWILGRMRLLGWLSEAEYQRAAAEPLRLSRARRRFQAPHFVDLLLSQAGEGAFTGQRGPVQTTLDLELNRLAESVLRGQLARLRSQRVRDGAVVVLDNRTGGVLALVGSPDYFGAESGQVNGAWAPRSAGSTFKPFTYLLAFEQGATAASVVADVPTDFATPTGLFRPANYNHRCYGPMRYRLALANSLNIAAVKVLASAGGPAALRKRLRDCGLTTLTLPPEHYGLGLTIGNAEARLLELVNAYACLARLGEFRPYHLLAREPALLSGDRAGGADSRQPVRVADAGAAWLVADILSDNEARAVAFGLDSSLRFEFPVACKTGTSSDFRDNWAIGYTPEFTVGVWVGNFDGSPMERVSGVTGAAPILHELFVQLHERYGTSWYAPPANLVARAVHPITGKLLSSPAPQHRSENGARVSSPEARRTWQSNGLTADNADDADEGPNRAGARVSSPAARRTWQSDGLTADNADDADEGPNRAGARVSSPAARRTGQSDGLTADNANDADEGPNRAGARVSSPAFLERFLALPPPESPADYDAGGRVRLAAEYREWAASADNWLAGQVVVDEAPASASAPLRLLSPLPGTTYFLDPDLPDSSRWLPLRAQAPPGSVWESDSLECRPYGAGVCARLVAGRHRLRLRSPATGKQAETWIVVKAR
jgi:penicillin-binding protein 1C